MTAETLELACTAFRCCANCGCEVTRLPSGKFRCSGCKAILHRASGALAPAAEQIAARAEVIRWERWKGLGLTCTEDQ